MNKCTVCKKEVSDWLNYCSWDCQVNEAKLSGGKVICPNNLPVSCITYDFTMLEHEHADHPDYKFPIYVEFFGKDHLEGFRGEKHALLYTDGIVAVTIYECCYAMWLVINGELLGGSLWEKDEWRLSTDAMKKIKNISK